MKKRQLINMGIPQGPAMRAAQEVCVTANRSGWDKNAIRLRLDEVIVEPEKCLEDEIFGVMAKQLIAMREQRKAPERAGASGDASSLSGSERGSGGGSESNVALDKPVPYKIYGSGFEAEAIQQIENACSLPISVRGALMPDAHVGYGLPIGGVLATRDAVIPYAVGVDIA